MAPAGKLCESMAVWRYFANISIFSFPVQYLKVGCVGLGARLGASQSTLLTSGQGWTLVTTSGWEQAIFSPASAEPWSASSQPRLLLAAGQNTALWLARGVSSSSLGSIWDWRGQAASETQISGACESTADPGPGPRTQDYTTPTQAQRGLWSGGCNAKLNFWSDTNVNVNGQYSQVLYFPLVPTVPGYRWCASWLSGWVC